MPRTNQQRHTVRTMQQNKQPDQKPNQPNQKTKHHTTRLQPPLETTLTTSTNQTTILHRLRNHHRPTNRPLTPSMATPLQRPTHTTPRRRSGLRRMQPRTRQTTTRQPTKPTKRAVSHSKRLSTQTHTNTHRHQQRPSETLTDPRGDTPAPYAGDPVRANCLISNTLLLIEGVFLFLGGFAYESWS